MTLLLIDDDQDDLKLFSHAFRDHGLSVEIASNLDEAVRLNKAPDYILLDARMDNGNTASMIRVLRSTYPDSCLAILTGLIDPGLVGEVIQIVSVPFFAKPVNVPNFAKEILPWLRK